jgi:hypothetical protein
VIIAAAPGVDVKHAIRRNDHVTDVTEVIGKHCRAETWGQCDTAIVGCAIFCRLSLLLSVRFLLAPLRRALVFHSL